MNNAEREAIGAMRCEMEFRTQQDAGLDSASWDDGSKALEIALTLTVGGTIWALMILYMVVK